MCGIVGYAGGRPALGIVLDGLRRLEYRGYDSAGVAVVAGGALSTEKRAGKLANLEKVLAESARPGIGDGTTGIGHTRWATHGGPTDRNAHPHVSADGRVAVIHNGIIENFAKLRAEVEATGVVFSSDTDTECVAHLLAAELASLDGAAGADGADGAATGNLAEAMRRVCRRLAGAFTLLAVDARTPGAVVGARRNSPLVVGRGSGGNFLASDVSAFIEHTREASELGQDQVVLASEFRYRDPVLDRSTLVVAISQSGETMDTLMALRHAKEQKARVLAICNTNGATIPRESDAVLYTHGGPEIAVASTKAFLTQLVACYLVGLHLAQVRGVMYADEVASVVDQLQGMPARLTRLLENMA